MNSFIIILILINNKISAISFNQPTFCPNATWDKNGITFANETTVGSEPCAIFVNTDNTVYVADQEKNEILVWFNNSVMPEKVISGTFSNLLSIFVTNNGDIYYGYTNGQVDKWILSTNTIVTAMNFNSVCNGLFIDINETLYCSMRSEDQVMKRWLKENVTTSTIAAGIGDSGSEPNQLSNPVGIFVDVNFDLYVADYSNSRIQLFESGQLNGKTVAGSKSSNPTIELNCPSGIVLDAYKYLFIVDTWNCRIVGSGPNGFRCLIGCDGSRSKCNQLPYPWSLSFDSSGNIFVTDQSDRRIQKFIFNKSSCNTTTTATTTRSASTHNSIISTLITSPSTTATETTLVETTSFETTPVSSTVFETTRAPVPSTSIGTTTAVLSTSMGTPTPVSSTSIGTKTSVPSTSTGTAPPVSSTPIQTTTPVLSTSIGTTTTVPSTLIGITTEVSSTTIGTTTPASSTSIETTTPVSSTPIETTRTVSLTLIEGTTTVPSTSIGLTTTAVSLTPIQTATTVSSTLIETTTTTKVSSLNFVAETCHPNITSHSCNMLNAPCNFSQPCLNNGTCQNDMTSRYGYYCLCLSGVSGIRCEINDRPCEPNPCMNDGKCNLLSNETFNCTCDEGWEGSHCQTQTNNCKPDKCQNKGVCRPVFKNYTCECLGDNYYSGRHCENSSPRIKIYKIVSKSFAFVAIIALIVVAMFIIIMDILKYCFGIDPVDKDRQQIRQKKQEKKRKPVIQRFVYVDAPPVVSSVEKQVPTTKESVF